MRRVVTIVGVFAVALALAARAGIRAWGDAADAQGHVQHPYRRILERQLRPWKASADRTVVWLGDSTILGLGGPSYPQLLYASLYLDGVRSRVVGWLGMDFYGYYFLTPTIIRELRPDVLVLVAHLRLFAPLHPPENPANERPGMNDLASYLGAADLWPALALPMAAHELPIPRFLLAQTLRLPGAEQLFRWFEGGRSLATGALGSELGPRAPERGRLEGLAMMRTALGDTDIEVTPRHPMVRMMAATVEYAVRRGTCVVVVGTPIPWESLARRRAWDPARYARRFAVLRAVVEASGGTFVDAHDALPGRELADSVGHFNPAGAAHMVNLVGGVVREAAAHGCAAAPRRMEAHADP